MEVLAILFFIAVALIALYIVKELPVQEANQAKLKRICQAIIDKVAKQSTGINADQYDFTDTITCNVPKEEKIFELETQKSFECTSIHSSSANRSIVVNHCSLDWSNELLNIDETNFNPEVKTATLGRGDVLDVQISLNEERSSTSTGQLSGRSGEALLGTALFGVAGGQIAASGRKGISMTTKEEVTIKSLALEIFTRNPEYPYLYIHFFPSMKLMGMSTANEAVSAGRITELQQYQQLMRWYAVFLALKDGPDFLKQDQQRPNNSDLATQIGNLYALKEKGVLSQEEFDQAKKRLIED